MPDYSRSTTVDVDADSLFDFLSDIGNLPRYFARMTSAEPAGGESIRTTAEIEVPGEGKKTVEGEAWFRVLDEQKRLEWGSEGPNDYKGELDVEAEGDGARVTVSLHTESGHSGIEDGMDETLATIARLAAEGKA